MIYLCLDLFSFDFPDCLDMLDFDGAIFSFLGLCLDFMICRPKSTVAFLIASSSVFLSFFIFSLD